MIPERSLMWLCPKLVRDKNEKGSFLNLASMLFECSEN